jgi:GNAT superfamily N-acetyltransferase
MNGVSVREARLEDAPACAKILREGWKRAFPRQRRRVDVRVFLNETEGETVLVAERRRRVIGFAAIYVPECFVHHLYVEPRSHRKGVGSLLLSAVRDRVNGPVSLKTQTENTRARAFYAKHGFAVTEVGDDGHGPWVRLTAPD